MSCAFVFDDVIKLPVNQSILIF